jgi:hypothetical protein
MGRIITDITANGLRGKTTGQGIIIPPQKGAAIDHLTIDTTPVDPNPRQVQAKLVIMATLDPDAVPIEWWIVDPEDVPAQVRKPATISKMMDGQFAKPPGSRYWYMAMTEGEACELKVSEPTA